MAQANANVLQRPRHVLHGLRRALAPSLERTIEGGPAALEQATHSLPYEAPFMEKSAEFMRLLRPSASALRTVAQPLGHAFAEGAVNLQRRHCAEHAPGRRRAGARRPSPQNPIVTLGLEDLTQTARLGNPLLAGLAPEQATCNYLTLAFRNVASLFSESIGVGTLARALPVLSPGGPNDEGFPASAPANGPSIDREASPVPGNSADDQRQPPALQPLPERRRPRPAEGVRSGQRDLRRRARP